MEAQEFDFEFPRGDTCPISFDLTDAEGNELDLSVAEIYFTLKKNSSTREYIIQKRLTTGDITYHDKKIKMAIMNEDTAGLNLGKYAYDFELKNGNYVKTILIGTIELTKEITWNANQ